MQPKDEIREILANWYRLRLEDVIVWSVDELSFSKVECRAQVWGAVYKFRIYRAPKGRILAVVTLA